MLLYLDDIQGKELLDLLITEQTFGTLSKSLYRTIDDVKEGLKDYGGRSDTEEIL